MSEYDLGPGLRLEERIDASEGEAVETRWEFGRWMLRHVRPSGNLPHKFLVDLSGATGKSRSELKYRRQFAERYDTSEKVANALATFGSWHEIVTEGFKKKRPKPPKVELPKGTFSVLYADPPWRYEHVETPELRAVENHYPTMTAEEIAALKVPAADDAVLFLWVTNPKLTEGLEVMEGWGFEYRTNLVWVKDRIGMGYYARAQHELLFVGRRGEGPVPVAENRPPSVIHAPRQEHSKKPEEVQAVIEAMYPGLPKIELFARQPRDGWEGFGNQLAEAA